MTGDDTAALLRRARDALAARRLDEAEAAAAALDPAEPDAVAMRGYVRAIRRDHADAIPFLERATAARPEPGWLALLADMYRHVFRGEDAERTARAAVAAARREGRGKPLAALARALNERDDLDGATEACLAALAIDPEDPEAHFALGELLLSREEWQPGWLEYDWRRRNPEWTRDLPRIGAAHWNGMRLAGGLLVVCDQGFGDTLQFARYLPAAARRVRALHVLAGPELAGLLGRMPGLPPGHGEVLAELGRVPPFTAHVFIGSLPGLLDPTGAGIAGAPYLAADPAQVARFRAEVAPGACRIGLAWAGRKRHPNDHRRSIPLAQFRGLIAAGQAAGARFVSLAPSPTPEDAAELREVGVADVAGALVDFDALAGLVASLDLVLTIDSAPVHLAGALGVPAWLLTPRPADWRWLREGTTSRWYDSVRLFRQDRPGAWAGVFEAVAAALSAFIAARAARSASGA